MSSVDLYLRLLRYVRPYWLTFAAAIAGMVVVAGGDAVMVWVTKVLVDSFNSPQSPEARLIPYALVAVFLLRGIGAFVSDYGMAWVGHRVVMDLRTTLTRRILQLPTQFFDRQATANLASKVTFDASQVASASSSALTAAIRGTLTIAVLLGWLVWLNWQLTALTFVLVPVIALIIRYFSGRLRRSAKSVQQSNADLNHVLEEAVTGQRVVKIFGGERYEDARATEAADRLRLASSRHSSAASASSPITQFLAACVVAVIVHVALGQSALGTTTVGEFAAYVAAMLRLLDQFKGLSGVNANLQRGIAAAESIFALLDEPPEVDTGTRELDHPRGHIVFERVGLHYDPVAAPDKPALTEIDLDIRPGETVALVGPSGGGKTSLVNLIPRFYSPSAGRLLIDGIDIREIRLANLRAHIALVSQDIVLFNDTIAANIAYGAMSGAGRAAIEAAALAAHALDFIRELPQGFDTQVGERGVRLSGGQRQRVAIARAVLKNARILILDEATSALDSESERHVQAALDELMRERTTIVIAHRLSTIERADRIVVLDAGRIVETGTHADLLRHDGVYARLHRIQFADPGSPR